MKYMLMIFEDESVYETEDDWNDIIAQHLALGQALEAEGVVFYGDGLTPTRAATTIRRRGADVTVHDGPFAETKEQLGGYYVVDVPDLDAALRWAKRIPLIGDGSVEVRPVIAESELADAAAMPG